MGEMGGGWCRVLAFDLSTHCGWAVLRVPRDQGRTPEARPVIEAFGRTDLPGGVKAWGEYPWGYARAAAALAVSLAGRAAEVAPDRIVIEETNPGRAGRYTQKLIEWLHLALLQELFPLNIPVDYVSSGEWRRVLGSYLTKEDRKLNATLKRAREAGREAEKKRELGVRGKVNRKHVSIRLVNAVFGLELRPKHENEADAIALCLAYLRGASKSSPT